MMLCGARFEEKSVGIMFESRGCWVLLYVEKWLEGVFMEKCFVMLGMGWLYMV
jgi:hypothetical protein